MEDMPFLFNLSLIRNGNIITNHKIINFTYGIRKKGQIRYKNMLSMKVVGGDGMGV
jgi:hypothetical protein